MQKSVDGYFIDGCGRCSLGGTPECRVNKWANELALLRRIILDCGIQEECKWGHPTYTYKKANVLILAAFKENCTLSFLKGALIQDEAELLQKPGENSQSARVMRFTNVSQILPIEAEIKSYIFESIEIEKAGLKVETKPATEMTLPEELSAQFKMDRSFEAAFRALTPGRQKGYIYFISEAKQSKTRESRIEKYRAHIMAGKGMQDK
jgi:uncharacterized protein YdeI (YjbR/CyaY-like superfamily)